MDDNKYFTVQVKGTAYRFHPFTEEDLSKVQTLSLMGANVEMVKAAMTMVSVSVGPEQWAAIIKRVSSGEVVLEDLVSVLKRVTERQVKEAQSADKAGV